MFWKVFRRKQYPKATGRSKVNRARRLLLEELEPRLVPTTSVTGYHNDNASTGQNLTEILLSPGTVNTNLFGLLSTTAVDGQVYAQPLYVPGVRIFSGPFQGIHNIVYAVTENDSLYAIDSANGNVLWQDSFLFGPYFPRGAFVTPVPSSDVNSGDLSPEIGITSTPAIDPVRGVIYLTTKDKEIYGGNSHFVERLHALYLSTGQEALAGPVVIADTISNDLQHYTYVSGPYVNGSGDGIVDNVNTFDGGHTNVDGTVILNALRQMQRPALTLANGNIYLGFGSHGDNSPYHGWLLSYTAGTLRLNGVLNTSPNGYNGAIWQAGDKITVDSQGNLFFMTGNGDFGTTLNSAGLPANGDYGDSFVKVAIDNTTNVNNQNINGWGLKVVDYFTPYNQDILNQYDADLGSGGTLLLPRSVNANPNQELLVGCGKEGKIYLVDGNNMGHFDPATDHVVQELVGANTGTWSSPAYYNGSIYFVAQGDHGKAYSISQGVMSSGPTSVTRDGYGYPGSTPSISANGSSGGIVWDLDRNTSQLRAYAASSYGTELYTSAQAGKRDLLPGGVVKFTLPTVADGKVFVGTNTSLVIFGLFKRPPPPPNSPLELDAAGVAGTPTQGTGPLLPSSSVETPTNRVSVAATGTKDDPVVSLLAAGLFPSTTLTIQGPVGNGGVVPGNSTSPASSTWNGVHSQELPATEVFPLAGGQLTDQARLLESGKDDPFNGPVLITKGEALG